MSSPVWLFSLLITCLINKDIKNYLIFYAHFHPSPVQEDIVHLSMEIPLTSEGFWILVMSPGYTAKWEIIPLDIKVIGENKTLSQNSGKWSPLCQKAAELDLFLIVFKFSGKNVRQKKRNAVTKFFLMSNYECLSCSWSSLQKHHMLSH